MSRTTAGHARVRHRRQQMRHARHHEEDRTDLDRMIERSNTLAVQAAELRERVAALEEAIAVGKAERLAMMESRRARVRS